MSAVLEQPRAMQSTQQSSVFPMAGESQSQFFDRANRALAKKIPKQNRRSVEIIRIWQSSPNDADLRDEAKERFPADRFSQQGPRAVFLSHSIPTVAEELDPQTGEVTREAREGTVYNRENIEKLINYANYRIRNSGMFAALAKGHMPSSEEKAQGIPDAAVLGYSGPFYLGMFGNDAPQWAIFSDEWIHSEDLPEAEKLQRRSPEIWFKEPIERRTMDPIAMLGSETPRLDSGMSLYCKRASDGQQVMRYSMGMATALPGATNCYVPSSETGQKHKYGASDKMAEMNQGTPKPPGAEDDTATEDSQANDALTEAVVAAISKLFPSIMQQVKDAQRAGDPNDPEAVPQDTPPIPEGSDLAENQVPRGMDDPQDPEPDATADPSQQQGQVFTPGTQNQNPAGYAASTPMQPAATVQDSPMPPVQQQPQPLDEQHAKYAAMSPECGMAYAAGHSAGCQKGRPMTTNYSKQSEELEARLNSYQTRFEAQEVRIEAQTKRIQDLETAARDTERYGKIHAIAMAHDIGDEQEVLRDVINVGDDEFDRYCKALRLAPKKGDVSQIELFDDPNLDIETENYSRNSEAAARRTGAKKVPSKDEIDRYSRQAADMTIRKRNKGVETTPDAELKTILVAAGYTEDVIS